MPIHEIKLRHGEWICSCEEPMHYPTLGPDGTAYDYQPGDRREIMCINKSCGEFEVRYFEPTFPVERGYV